MQCWLIRNLISIGSEVFENKIEKFLIPQTVERIKEYLDKLS